MNRLSVGLDEPEDIQWQIALYVSIAGVACHPHVIPLWLYGNIAV
jgi:hypothetical protein